jgi:hypothetical protein
MQPRGSDAALLRVRVFSRACGIQPPLQPCLIAAAMLRFLHRSWCASVTRLTTVGGHKEIRVLTIVQRLMMSLRIAGTLAAQWCAVIAFRVVAFRTHTALLSLVRYPTSWLVSWRERGTEAAAECMCKLYLVLNVSSSVTPTPLSTQTNHSPPTVFQKKLFERDIILMRSDSSCDVPFDVQGMREATKVGNESVVTRTQRHRCGYRLKVGMANHKVVKERDRKSYLHGQGYKSFLC